MKNSIKIVPGDLALPSAVDPVQEPDGVRATGKPWARMREHGPCMIFDWHETREAAEAAIEKAVEYHGEHIRKFHTIAFFPRRANAEQQLVLSRAEGSTKTCTAKQEALPED
jgi:hypothetical protein